MATATIQVAYEAETSSLKATVNEINQINDVVVKGAQESATKVKKSFDGIANSFSAAFGGTQTQTALNNQEKAITKLATSGKTLTGQLKGLKQELALLEQAGQEGTAAFNQLLISAAKLEDQIGDTRARVKILASDTFKFDAAVGATQALASGFEVAQGAAALFGGESEQLQQAILKVTAATAVANGVQQLAQLIQEENAAKTAVLTIAQRINAASIRQSAISYNVFGVAVQFSARSLNILKGALVATGVGALVIGIGFLIEKLQEQKERTDAVAQATKDSAAANIKAKETLASLARENEDINNKLLVQAGEITQAESDRRKVRSDAAAEFKTRTDAEFNRQGKFIIQEENLTQALKDRQNDFETGEQALKQKDKDIALLQKQIKEVQRLRSESVKTVEDIRKESDKKKGGLITIIDEAEAKKIADDAKAAADKAKAIRDKAIQDRITAELNGLKVTELIDGETLANKEAQLKKQAELEKANAVASIENANLRASTIKLIDAKLGQDIAQINVDAQNKIINDELRLIEIKKANGTATIKDELAAAEKSFTIESNNLKAKIDAGKATKTELELLEANYQKNIKDITNAGEQERLDLTVQALELRKLTNASSLEDEIRLINARAESELKANADSNKSVEQKEADRLKIIATTDLAVIDAKKQAVDKELELDDVRIATLRANGELRLEDAIKEIENERDRKINALDKNLLSEKEYADKVKLINAETQQAITEETKTETEKRIDLAVEYADQVQNVLGSINELSKIASEERIADISASSEAELEAINNSSALERDKIVQREALAKRTAIAVAAEKTKQARLDKALAIFDIGVNTAIAISKANTLLPPANIPAMIAAGIAGALQLALVIAKPIPKFAQGGLIGGKLHSQGGTMIEAEQGEYMVNRRQTSKHRRELDAMNHSTEAFRKMIDERYVRPALMGYSAGRRGKEGVTVNASLNSKSMEKKLDTINKSLKGRNVIVNINQQDSRYTWQ